MEGKSYNLESLVLKGDLLKRFTDTFFLEIDVKMVQVYLNLFFGYISNVKLEVGWILEVKLPNNNLYIAWYWMLSEIQCRRFIDFRHNAIHYNWAPLSSHDWNFAAGEFTLIAKLWCNGPYRHVCIFAHFVAYHHKLSWLQMDGEQTLLEQNLSSYTHTFINWRGDEVKANMFLGSRGSANSI